MFQTACAERFRRLHFQDCGEVWQEAKEKVMYSKCHIGHAAATLLERLLQWMPEGLLNIRRGFVL